MEIEIPETFAGLANADLTALRSQLRTAGAELVSDATPTAEQISLASNYVDAIATIDAEFAQRAAVEAMRSTFSETDPETEAVEAPVEEAAAEAPAEVEDEPVVEAAVEVEAAPEAAAPAEAVTPPAEDSAPQTEAAVTAPSVAAAAAVISRPEVPADQANRGLVTITAAADVPNVATGSELDMRTLGDAMVNRMKGFAKPTGKGGAEDLRHFGVASIRRPFPEDLTIEEHSNQLAVLQHAADENRLTGNSLVAAGGWCSPSEVLYDLCESETTDGMLSVPEVQVNRGGIKYTTGPDFSDIYDNVGFYQTEEQAIAGTAKTCFEVPCPDWDEVRLGAIGLCIKAPILTNAAYPELVQRWLRGALVAHQHKVNARVISSIATALGTPKVLTDITTTAGSLLGGLELLIDQQRGKYRWSMNETLEVVVPYWVRGALRSDLALRTGQNIAAVTDAMIAAEFAARHAVVQYVYDWQNLNSAAVVYPETFDVLIYRAGTFIKGTSDVISLNAVYDAASLATNLYTALFFEEGLLVTQLCPGGVAATVAVCNTGRTGIANLAVCNSGASGGES